MSSAHACARFDRSCMVAISLTWSRKSEQIPNSQPTNVKLMFATLVKLQYTPMLKYVECLLYSRTPLYRQVRPLVAAMPLRQHGPQSFRGVREWMWMESSRGWVDQLNYEPGGLFSLLPVGWGNDKYLFIHPFKFQVPTFWSTNGICEDHWQNACQGIDGPWIGID